MSDGYKDERLIFFFLNLSKYVSTGDEMKVNGIQITENPHHCPQMNSMVMFSAHGRASPDSSR